VRRYNDKCWQLQWTCFEPDRAFSVVDDDHKAGYFSYRLYFESFEQDKNASLENWEDKIKAWKKKKAKRLNMF